MWRQAQTPKFDPSYTISTDGRDFQVRVPRDEKEKNRGYREVERIGSDECMLFMYPTPRAMTFTMEHCKVGLRIVFCDSMYRVLQVSDAMPGVKEVPCNNTACQNVIEFALAPRPPLVRRQDTIVVTRTGFKQEVLGMDAFLQSVFGLN